MVEWVVDHQGSIHLEHLWKVHSFTMLVDSMPMGGMFSLLCLFGCCSRHPSWWCPQFLCGFPHPGHLEGPEEHPLGLAVSEQGFVVKQALFRHSLAQCPFSPKDCKCDVAFVMWLGSGLIHLKMLNKGMNFGLGKGRRWCLGVLGV